MTKIKTPQTTDLRVLCIFDTNDDIEYVLKKDDNGKPYVRMKDKMGNEVPPDYRGFSDLSKYDYSKEELFLAAVGKIDDEGEYRYGYIDKSGKEVVSCIYEHAGPFREGLAAVGRFNGEGEEKFGYIDRTGKEVIPCIYEYASSFSNGLAAVQKEEEWSCINTAGEEVSFSAYGDFESVSVGEAFVYGWIWDENGHRVTTLFYNPIQSVNSEAIPLGGGVFNSFP